MPLRTSGAAIRDVGPASRCTWQRVELRRPVLRLHLGRGSLALFWFLLMVLVLIAGFGLGVILAIWT